MATQTNNTELLCRTLRAAAHYLGCSRKERLAWFKPDRRLVGDVRPESGARIWRPATLDAARSYVEAWRERDRVASAARAAELSAQQEAATARRKGMRKGSSVTAKIVCERLGCSLTELNRWALDGRFSPDGEILMAGLPKTVHARAWPPVTIDAAKTLVDGRRNQDQAKKTFKRRGLRLVA